MSNLPEWIEEMGPDIYKHDAKLQEALSIAWEALERESECIYTIIHGRKIAKEAMRRIEEMGK